MKFAEGSSKNLMEIGQHWIFLLFMVFCFGMGCLMWFLWYVVSLKVRKVRDKKTSFECGFDALSNSFSPFTLRFYLIALLFLVVDVEIILLFPFVFSNSLYLSSVSWLIKFVLVLFLGSLVVGILHEENEGSLEWKM